MATTPLDAASAIPTPGAAERPRDPRPALATFYFAQFLHLGIIVPFLPIWLEGRGFSALAIGALLALPSIFKVAAPWLWARWADRSGRRKELFVVAVAGAAVALGVLVGLPAGWPLVAGFAVYGFCRSPLLPFAEVTSLEQATVRGFSYGPIRLWGSIAFIVGSLGFGAVVKLLSPDAALYAGALCLGLATVAALGFPRPLPAAEVEAAQESGGERRLDSTQLALFLFGCALMQTSHGAYYTFYSLRLEALGYGEIAIGAFWAFAVICEVLLFTRLDALIDRLGTRRVLLGSALLAAVRWALIGSTGATPWLILGQTFHAATYAAFHVASIRIVFRAYGRERAKGQAIFSGMTYGIGNVVGSLGAGALAASLGLGGLFWLSSAIALASVGVIAPLKLPRRRR